MATRRNSAGQLYSTRTGQFVDDPRHAALRDPVPVLDPAAFGDYQTPETMLRGMAERMAGPFGGTALTVDGEVYQAGDAGGDEPPWLWKGVIRDAAGNQVGTFERSFLEDGTVCHADLHLAEEHQGKGFATEFNRAAEAEYEQMGFHTIYTWAVGDGAYAWAKSFEFNDSSPNVWAARETIARAMRREAEGEPFSINNMNPRKLAPEDKERVRRMADLVEAGNHDVTIRDVADLAVDGFPELGRKILKSGLGWPGRRRLGEV
ncbi:hypothetical protein ACFVAJ_18435 [Agromyces sp. NPDC057679]|uniref:hypothetical protein n=1 Tax=Agromyces sp. NPDC057679 TaxID=3346207 RepID=UPI00366B276B